MSFEEKAPARASRSVVRVMKLTVKTVKNAVYTVDAEPTDSILAIKERLHTTHGVGEASSQRLIHQGRIISDDTHTVADLSLREGDFLVLMVKGGGSAPASASISASAPAQAPTAPAPASAPAPAPPEEVQPAERQYSPEDEEKLSNLCAMGFPREQAVAALAAAYGNADRAVTFEDQALLLVSALCAHTMLATSTKLIL